MAKTWHPASCCHPGEKPIEADDIKLNCRPEYLEHNDTSRFPQFLVSRISNLQSTVLGEYEKAVSSLRAENQMLRDRLFALETDFFFGLPTTHHSMDFSDPLAQEDLGPVLVPNEREWTELSLHPSCHLAVDLLRGAQISQTPKLETSESEVMPKLGKYPTKQENVSGQLRISELEAKQLEVLTMLGKLAKQQEYVSERLTKMIDDPPLGKQLSKSLKAPRSWSKPMGRQLSPTSEGSGSSRRRHHLDIPCDRATFDPFTQPHQRKDSATKRKPATDRKDDNLRQIAESVSQRQVSVKRGAMHSSYMSATQTCFSAWRERVQRLVWSGNFEACIFAVIFTNVVFVGIEVDYMAMNPGIDTPFVFAVINNVYTCVFLVELLLRMFAAGCHFFALSRNRDWSWNWFDSFVVLSSVLENAASSIVSSTGVVDMVHFRVIRVIRVTRLLRTFRMVRMVRFVRALRTLVHSIITTLRAAIWSLLLMTIIFYGFGVAFTQAVMDYCDSQFEGSIINSQIHFRASGCSDQSLTLFFGTLPRSMLTLFQCISGGLSWHDVLTPLSSVGTLWVVTFNVFIIFTLFAVLNVVTGLFCQSAIDSAQQDKDIATMQLMANKGHFNKCLDELFNDIDSDQSGWITVNEFEDAVDSEKCKAFFESLEIPVNDAWALFKLLDSDESGTIDKDEFFMGLLHLRGNASAVDIAKMVYDNKVFFGYLEDFMAMMEERMMQLLQAVPKAASSNLAAEEACTELQANWSTLTREGMQESRKQRNSHRQNETGSSAPVFEDVSSLSPSLSNKQSNVC